MKKFDWSGLDAGLLELLVAALDSGSITGAAQRLGVTQSAVSHQLNRLRAITGDALFVKSGRGVVATARAEALGPVARDLLRDLERFARSGGFDPARWQTRFTIAANDYQCDLLLPALARRLRTLAPGVTLRIVPSGVPVLDTLRMDTHQLVISPRPPDGTDILQTRLFTDRYRVFFDAAVRGPPGSRADYLAARHATVVYEPRRSLELDQRLLAAGYQREFAVTVPAFSALPSFIRGTDLLATAPGLLSRDTFADLGTARPPVPCPEIGMYMIWHARYQADPAHSWLRARLLDCAAALRTRGAP